MIRRLLTILATLSLLLCAAVVVMGMRSYWRFDSLAWGGRTGADVPTWRVWWFQSGRGGAAVVLNEASRLPTRPPVPAVFDLIKLWVAPVPPDRVFETGSLDFTHYPWDQEERVSWRLGFGLLDRIHPGNPAAGGGWLTRRQRVLVFPHWAAFLATATPPALWALGRRRQWQKARRLGFCPRCGYDLRASKERCPECGEPVPAAGLPAACR